MKTNIQLFNNPKFGDIRMVEINGNPYFVAADVAKCLGYAKPNNAVNTHCKHATLKQGIIDSIGREQSMSIIPEGDIYRLAAKSELPGAEEFESWIFDEVLPSIRKHGVYTTPAMAEKMLNDPDVMIKVLTALKNERKDKEKLQIENNELSRANEVLEAENEKMLPRSQFVDIVFNSDRMLTMSQAAKSLGYGRNILCKKLREIGVFFANSNEPKQRYIDNGYFKYKPKVVDNGNVVMQPFVSQKGLGFIAKKLGIVVVSSPKITITVE